MNRWQEILLVVIILILLIMASSKKTEAASVTSKLLDPQTGLPIGLPGVRNSAIGPALLPYSNDSTNPATIEYVKNPETALCPTGFVPVIDPDTGGIYCVTPELANV